MYFAGTLSARDFSWAVVNRIIALIVVTVAFPYLLLLILVGGGWGLLVAMVARPAIYVAFCLSFIPITLRRMRDAGLPAWQAYAIVFVLLGDVTFGMSLGGPPALALPTGLVWLWWPSYLLSGLACLAALSLLPTGAQRRRGSEAPAAPVRRSGGSCSSVRAVELLPLATWHPDPEALSGSVEGNGAPPCAARIVASTSACDRSGRARHASAPLLVKRRHARPRLGVVLCCLRDECDFGRGDPH